MKKGKTLIIGASENPDRYANRAAHSLLRYGHDIEMVGLREGQIRSNPIQTGLPELSDIETVTLYVSAKNQPGYTEYIKHLKPQRVIFNPGTENPAFEQELIQEGIEPIHGCTLVMLSVGAY
ncbi:CoA-binding protein [Tellurirhabdus bombi]|uniref:CoA-binding protein n=1 Tax=Tellurirhabdus bombi TaxID=2907205 RepID=UPI001F33D373|nr:CoA-binding protein [Tellurirhabdus bombi]